MLKFINCQTNNMYNDTKLWRVRFYQEGRNLAKEGKNLDQEGKNLDQGRQES